MMDIHQTIRASLTSGRLGDALAQAGTLVKAEPTNLDARTLLADLLSIAGDNDRTELQLVALEKLSPTASLGCALHRQLLRASAWRQDCFTQGRVPAFLDPLEPSLMLHLRAITELRAGDEQAAQSTLAEAENAREAIPMCVDGVLVDDFRDADDLTSSFWEVLTSNGKYYWIPMSRVRHLELRPPKRPRDLIWRQATMTVHEGPEGEVFLPTIYAPVPDSESARLGLSTDWFGSGVVRGVGQRLFLVGDEGRPMSSIATLEPRGRSAE